MKKWQVCGIAAAIALAMTAGSALASYSSVVQADNPAAYWGFNETSGTTAADATGHGLDLTYQNAPTLGVPGAVGTAVAYDGATQYADRWDGNMILGGQSGTVEAWVNTTSSGFTPVANWYASSATGEEDQALFALYVSNGSARAAVRDVGSHYFDIGDSGTINDGQWHHLVMVLDQTNKGLNLYVDGQLKNSTGLTDFGNLDNTVGGNPPFSVGSYLYEGNRGLGTAAIDEVALYTYTLSGSQIQAHFAAVPEPMTIGLLTLGALWVRRKQ
jgi:hypothetical protein